MNAHAHLKQTNSIQDASGDVQTKRCQDCRSVLTVNHFGVSKLNKDGYSNICNACRAQYVRLRRKVRFKTNSVIDDSIIRSVHRHNKTIINAILKHSTFECRGFIPGSSKVFRIHFGKSRYDFPSLAIFSEDGSMYHEQAFSGLSTSLMAEALLKMMKLHKIRLELTDADVILSKRVIYMENV